MSNEDYPTATHAEIWCIDSFVPYARNPRKNDAAVDRMAASIREFGFKIPVLARSSGEVVDGHLRLKAARKLGISRRTLHRKINEMNSEKSATVPVAPPEKIPDGR